MDQQVLVFDNLVSVQVKFLSPLIIILLSHAKQDINRQLIQPFIRQLPRS